VQTGQELLHFHEHRGRIFTAAFSTDGRLVTSVGEDRRLVRYDVEAKRVISARELAPAKLMSMCLINDDLVAAAGADNSIHLYDTLAGELVAELRGHSGTVAVMGACGEFLASGSFDTTVRIWNLERIAEQDANFGRPVRAKIKMDSGLQIR
jgi:WD40 repeat protein